MEAVMDSNFIISCVKRKIDFIGELEMLGFEAVVPREVIDEMKDLRLKVSHEDRVAIDVAFEIFAKKKVKKTKIGGRTVDEGLINKGKQGVFIATLDNQIRRMIPNKIGIEKAKNRIIIERD